YNGFVEDDWDYYYSSLFHGLLEMQIDYNADGKKVNTQEAHYKLVTERKLLGDGAKVNLYGYYIQQDSNTNILKSLEFDTGKEQDVEQKIAYEYDLATGLVRGQTTKNYNSLGEEEIHKETYVYGWEKYDQLKEQNILTPVVQTTNQVNEKITAISVSTWKDWGDGKWGEFKTYQAKTETATFEQWGGSEPPTSNWLKVSEVISRTEKGAVNDSINIDGIHNSVIFDKQQLYPVASFVNAAINEGTYVGFEAYENLENWHIDGVDLSDCIVTGDAHTGVSSLRLEHNSTLRRDQLTISNPDQTYILSAWLKTENGFETDGGKVEAQLLFYHEGNPIGNPIVLEIGGTDSQWIHWHHAISSSDIQWSQIELKISNQKQSKSLLIDNICFVPKVGELKANVYEDKYKIVTAKLNSNGDTQRYLYDSFQRKVADIGLGETVNSLSMSYLTRQGQEDVTFVQDKPNSILSISAAEGGVFANFTNGEQWREDWEIPEPSNWSVENNALIHTVTSSDSITYKSTAAYTNYGVRLSVHPVDTLDSPLGIRLGNKLTISWTPSLGWNLEINGNSYPVADTGIMPQEWLLVAANNAILFYADGQQIFSQITDDSITGALELFAEDEVAFKNIVTFKSPQLAISYTDAAGKERQSQVLDGKNCIVSAKVYDTLYRPAIQTKAAKYTDTLFSYQPGFVESIDWQTGILTGKVANDYLEDQGYPYSRTVWESSPLERPLQEGIPGKEFAFTGANSHVATREYGTNQKGFFAGDV
ncbi:MAG: hypothetical protein F6K65_31940, partial [Moorea sp. SIO3C2]|nr:hypothetical protein [Moorena sp. SIO3C2]